MPDKIQQNTVNSETAAQSDSKIETQAHGWGFSGLFLIVLGSYLLLANLGYIEWLSVFELIKYWPLLLVFLGLKLLIKNDLVWKLMRFLLILLLIIWLLGLLFGVRPRNLAENQLNLNLPRFWQTRTRQKQSTSYSLSSRALEGVETRTLNLNLSIGEIMLQDSSRDLGFELDSQHWEALGEPQITEVIENSNLELTMDVKETTASWPEFNPSEIVPSYIISYGNREMVTDLNFNLQLGSAVIELNDVSHQIINLNNDLGSMELTLGSSALPKQLNLQTGMGAITVSLPADVDLRVDYKVGLGSLNIDGERLLGEGVYQTEAISNQPELKIQAEVGVGSIQILRFSP